MINDKPKRLRKIYLKQAEDIPNSPLPVLIYRGVLAPTAKSKAAAFRSKFEASGWSGIWTDTIYDYTHFHSNAHEVLGIAEGKVTVRLGGEQGCSVHLKAGDMLVLPAGVGHRRTTEDDSGLKIIGAYPRGQSHFTMKRKGNIIPKVPLPNSDPFYGNEGPLMRIWT